METMDRVHTVIILLMVSIVAAGAAARCGRSQTNSNVHPHAPPAWCNFDKMSARSGGNHPDYYSAECKQDKLSLNFSRTYGTDQIQLTLDLSTGEISGSRTQPRRMEFAVKPPDQGGDYFDHQSHLDTAASGLKTMINLAGEWGNNGIDAAKLNGALAYIKNLSAKAAALPGIDRLKRYHSWQMILGLKTTVQIEYKVSAARDILVSFGTTRQIYAQTRTSVAAGAGTAGVTIELPLTVDDAETAFLCIELMSSTRKLDEVISPVTLEKGDKIFNLYTDNQDGGGYADDNFYAGKENHFYANWCVARDRDLIVRLIDGSGKAWAERRLPAKTGGNDSARLTLYVPENTPSRKDEYQLIIRIVLNGGSWDDVLDEQVGGFNRRLTVK
jgi:hypothetical protein